MKKNKLIHGVGINDLPGMSQSIAYRKWRSILQRCYSDKAHPNYIFVEVCKEWLTFSNFKSWMEQQDWQGKEIDKDLFGNGYLYSPENCCFLPRRVNTLIIESRVNNKSGIPCIKRYKDLFVGFVSFVEKGEIVRESFEKLDDAINFVVDVKLEIIDQIEVEANIKNKLAERYENFRNYYLNDKGNTLRQSENARPGKRKVFFRDDPVEGQVFWNSKGWGYVVKEFISHDKIIVQGVGRKQGEFIMRKDNLRRLEGPLESFKDLGSLK